MKKSIEFTQEEIDIIIKMYNKENLSTVDIGKKFKVGQYTILNVLRRSKIKIKNIRSAHKYEEIYFNDLKSIERNAKNRNISFNISIEYLWELYIAQNRKCNLSRIPIKFDSECRLSDGTASLDRISSSNGYIEGNVQWIHKDINLMKNYFNQDFFIDICKKIAYYN